MSYKTFNKEIVRAVTGSWGRFLAIFAIVALGVGFYSGLMMTEPDMERSADAFYDGTHLADVRVVSTLGLTDEDLDALSEIDGVEAVMGAYETDVVAEVSDEPYSFRVHSLSDAALTSSIKGDVEVESDDDGYVNRLILAEGRWPENPNECVISADRIMNTPVQPGDLLKVAQGVDDVESVLDQTEFEIVGLVHSSYYTSSTTMGSTSLGTGRIQQFMYVPSGSFASDYPYTEAFITVACAREMDSSSEAYDSLVLDVMSRIEVLAPELEQARVSQLKSDAQAKLDEARSDFDAERADAERELADAKAKLDAAESEISQSASRIVQAQQQYDSGKAQLASQKAQAAQRFEEAESSIAAKQESLEKAAEDLAYKRREYEAAKPFMTPEEIAQTEAALAQAQAQLDEGEAQLKAAEQELSAQRQAAQEQFAQAETALESSSQQLAEGRLQLSQGKSDYESGLASYEDARTEADAKFADAEQELADAQADIDAIADAEWLVMDRTKNYGAESYAQDSERIGSIAQVFPLIFFLVAALVALTTMTRMVEEERMIIGTYKALGYSRSRISSKYLLYALTASLGGSIVGIAALSFTLPVIIMSAYSIVYIVPPSALAIDWPIALGATALGVGITLAATWGAVASTLRESPAALMLPRAPKPGRRILMERIKPLWSRLSFLWKVTCRNIFRYKKRMVMTVIGIAGCTALLLTGFGLYNSINDILDIHFTQLVKYNTTVVLEDDASAEDGDAAQELLSAKGDVRSSATAVQRNVVALGNARDYAVPIVVPTDPEDYEQIHVLRERTTHAPLRLADDGALITEKLGTLLGVGAGDVIEVAEPDSMGNATGNRVQMKVAGLIENYVENGIYMTDAYYRQVFGEPPLPESDLGYNAIYVDSGLDAGGRSALSDAASPMDAIKTLAYNDETIDSYRSSLRSVNMIVYVLIGAAALLAFIVLYNLTNINITERMREIATLKVLGFTQREVQHYIFREIVLLAMLGALVGLVVGIFLENFVVVTAEVDAAMFGRVIHLESFVLAFVLTMAFMWVVTLFMRGKLARVDMVESLKSNE